MTKKDEFKKFLEDFVLWKKRCVFKFERKTIETLTEESDSVSEVEMLVSLFQILTTFHSHVI
jgi:hypothetical protein